MSPRLAYAAFLLAMCFTAAGCDQLRTEPTDVKVQIDGHRFTLDLAVDDAARIQGLKGRTEIDAERGMLFVFTTSQVQSFWMADCLMDIDIIFVDPQGRITAMHRMKRESPRRSDETQGTYEGRLRRYSSNYPAQFAIELQGGWLDRLDLAVDTKLDLDPTRLKALAR